MGRSINNANTDWRREWEEEITLTPEEQKEANRLKAIEDSETAQILEDIHMMELEEERERDERKSKIQYAKSYLKERGWNDTVIWSLSDAEVLECAEGEAAYEEEVYDFYDFGEDRDEQER